MSCLGSVATVNEVSLHPPHLIESTGSLTPAALIPFCAYQTNMTLLGQKTEGINFIPCTKFKPSLLEGQLCYSLNLSSLEKWKTKPGKRAGLVLLLDSGRQNSKEPRIENTKLQNTLDLESSGYDDHSPKIYLNTLSSFTDFRVGSYGMAALKKMSGTESFLKQTDETKKCRIETFEECEAKAYLDTVQKKCDCVPWALSRALLSKV